MELQLAQQRLHVVNDKLIPPNRPSVLIVDDELAILGLLKVFLGQLGFTVWLAVGGRHALDLFNDHREIKLALLEVTMRDLDGPSTLLELRRIDPDLPCCFMTGNRWAHAEEELRGIGASHILHKPFAFSKLAAVVQQLAAGDAPGEFND